jgi:hypothetical protein
MDKVTWEEFAKTLRKKYPQYSTGAWKDIPDTQFVDFVLAEHPEWKSKVYGANVTEQQRAQLSVPPAIPKPRGFDVHPVRYGVGVTPEQEAGETERRLARREEARKLNEPYWTGRMANRIASQGQSLEDTITGLVKMGEPGTAEYRQMVDYLNHPRFTKEAKEQPWYQTAAELTTAGIPPVGMAKDWLKDPANLAGDVLLGYTMGAAEAPGEFDLYKNRYPTGTGVKAGWLWKSKTRAANHMNWLDPIAKDIPVGHSAYPIVRKALDLEERYGGPGGWQAPAWMHKYAQMVESGLKGGKEPIPGRPGEFIDRPPSMNPLTYEHARNFEVAAGEKINWDDPGGKMNALQKQARKAIGKQDIASGLQPYGLDRGYLQAKADFTKAYGAEAMWGPFGKVAGMLAGFGAGRAVGHPFALGYMGGRAGESIAGQLVRSITEAGKRGAEETELDMATRRGGGGVSPADRLRMATDRVNSIKMHLARNPGDYNAVSQLRVAEDAMVEASKGMWPEQYKQAPQTPSRQGGGGANYTADQLTELKKKYGIK